MGNSIIDVLIIGGGIASNASAIYSARADLNTLVFSGPELDQLSLTTLVENFVGFPEGIVGPELIRASKLQAQKFGAKYKVGFVKSFKPGKKFHEVIVGGKKYKSKTVIICTGASAKTLNVPGKTKYFGKGVSICAVCDAALYRGKEAIVIGGGDSAMEEALALAKFAKKVIIVHRANSFRASKVMQNRVFKNKKIKIIWDTELKEILGDGSFVSGAKLRNNKTGRIVDLKINGIFFAIGHKPNTNFLNKQIATDKLGYIITDKRNKTNVPGVFAAGDVQDPIFRQAITSAGSGAKAALSAEWYIEGISR